MKKCRSESDFSICEELKILLYKNRKGLSGNKTVKMGPGRPTLYKKTGDLFVDRFSPHLSSWELFQEESALWAQTAA